MLECTLNFGKKNIIFIWSCKRPLEIDKTLRASSVDYFCRCNMRLKSVPTNYSDYIHDSGYLDAHYLEVEIYDALTLKLDRIVTLDHLELWCQLFDTKEEISSPAYQ